MSQTKPTPQLSCSNRGSYRPRALGIPRASSSCSALGLRLVIALLRKARSGQSRRPLPPCSDGNQNRQRDCCGAPPKRPANVSLVPPMSIDAPSTDGSNRATGSRQTAGALASSSCGGLPPSPGVLPRGGGSRSQNHSGESSRCCSATTPAPLTERCDTSTGTDRRSRADGTALGRADSPRPLADTRAGRRRFGPKRAAIRPVRSRAPDVALRAA